MVNQKLYNALGMDSIMELNSSERAIFNHLPISWGLLQRRAMS